MPIILLGASGFLGKTVAEELRASQIPFLEGTSQNCNLLSSESVRNFFSSVKEPFELIFCAVIKRTRVDNFQTLLTNIQMVENLREIQTEKLKRIIYISTTDVYGNHPSLPITENSTIRPASYYAISKLIGEQLLELNKKIPLTILRVPGFFGVHDRNESVVGRLSQQLRTSQRVVLSGDGKQKRDYIDASDISRVICNLLQAPYDGILNVASGISLSLLEWVQLIAETLKIRPQIDFETHVETAGDLSFDVSCLKKVLPQSSCRSPFESVPFYLSRKEEMI